MYIFTKPCPSKSIWSIFGSSIWLSWDSILSNFIGRHLGGGWYGPAVLDYNLEKHLHYVGLLLKPVSPCLALLKQSLQQIVLDVAATWSAPLEIKKINFSLSAVWPGYVRYCAHTLNIWKIRLNLPRVAPKRRGDGSMTLSSIIFTLFIEYFLKEIKWLLHGNDCPP